MHVVAVAMLFNTANNTYHPIAYRDAPLPGPAENGKPRRVKSIGHHTAGFSSFEAAEAHVREVPEFAKAEVVELDPCLAWDGADIPASVAYIQDGKLIVF